MATELSNLPVRASAFIGREAELARVRALVGGSRLVTLTGVGGAGKTRLALAAAGLLESTADGVWFADLAPLGDPGLVTATVADVLGVRLTPGHAVPEALAAAVSERRLLLVLDNCEHLIEACAKLADTLLRGCPELTLLATSREPLGIDGEQVYRVPSLGVPAEDAAVPEIRGSEAVRLLADRAANQGVTLAPDEQTARMTGRICRRLDGIPLAIELAAARLRTMTLAQLEARLDERFALLTGGPRAGLPRQQTLRAMVDWSWDLLAVPEQTVLARLSVFAGSFGLAAAEAVAAEALASEAVAAGQGVPAAGVPRLLGGLVDKSLVQFGDAGAGPGRYRLLETVRQYAAIQLDALGSGVPDAARIAHRDYYVALAEDAAPHLEAAGQVEWLDRLDAELGNLRAALAVSLTQPDPWPGLRLATLLRWYWGMRGHAAEGADALRALLSAPAAREAAAREATLARGQALSAAATLLVTTGGYATAADYCSEALAIARAAGDERLAADVLRHRAWILLRQGHPDAALRLAESGLEAARRSGEPFLTAGLLSLRGVIANDRGEVDDAVRDTSEALRLYRQVGNRLQMGYMLGNLGYNALLAGDLDAARQDLAESLDIARASNDRAAIACQAFNLGMADYLGGVPEAGTRFAESLDLARRTGMRSQAAYALLGLALAGRDGAGRDGAGQDWSARLHGAADRTFAELGQTLEPLEARLAAQDRERLRTQLGDEAFEAEYAAGHALDPGQVAAEIGRVGAAAEPAPVRAQVPPARPVEGHGRGATTLTARELDVLRLVVQGLSNRGIAQRLVLSEHTIHRHLASIRRKLDVPSRAAAAAWAVRTGLV